MHHCYHDVSSRTAQRLILPNIITLSGVLDLVPVEDGDDLLLYHTDSSSPETKFDALEILGGKSAAEATEWVYDHYGDMTTTMSKMNPGLDTHRPPYINPPLNRNANLGLVDFIVKERLFNFFLNDGCIPFTAEHALMEKMISDGANNSWPRPGIKTHIC